MNMKKFLKTLGIILLVLVVIAAVFVVWQWRYVKALIDGIRYDEEELGRKQLENAEKTISSVNEQVSVPLREITEEEKQKIASGELSQTALMAQILAEALGTSLPDSAPVNENSQPVSAEGGAGTDAAGGAAPSDGEAALPPSENTASGGENSETSQKPSQQTGSQPNASQPNSSQPSSSGQTNSQQTAPQQTNPANASAAQSSDQMIAGAVSKLYELQAQYTSQLDGLVGRAKAYYHEQKAQNGSAAAKSSTAAKFSGEVASMENSCDAKVEAVINDLTQQLKSVGADTSITSTLRSAYQNEKSIQRAAYVNKYMK